MIGILPKVSGSNTQIEFLVQIFSLFIVSLRFIFRLLAWNLYTSELNKTVKIGFYSDKISKGSFDPWLETTVIRLTFTKTWSFTQEWTWRTVRVKYFFIWRYFSKSKKGNSWELIFNVNGNELGVWCTRVICKTSCVPYNTFLIFF